MEELFPPVINGSLRHNNIIDITDENDPKTTISYIREVSQNENPKRCECEARISYTFLAEREIYETLSEAKNGSPNTMMDSYRRAGWDVGYSTENGVGRINFNARASYLYEVTLDDKEIFEYKYK